MHTPDTKYRIALDLQQWGDRAKLAASAADAFENLSATAARIRDFDEEDARIEVLGVAHRAMVGAHASWGHEEQPDPGFAILVARLGGADAAVLTLLSVIRTLTEEVEL